MIYWVINIEIEVDFYSNLCAQFFDISSVEIHEEKQDVWSLVEKSGLVCDQDISGEVKQDFDESVHSLFAVLLDPRFGSDFSKFCILK